MSNKFSVLFFFLIFLSCGRNTADEDQGERSSMKNQPAKAIHPIEFSFVKGEGQFSNQGNLFLARSYENALLSNISFNLPNNFKIPFDKKEKQDLKEKKIVVDFFDENGKKLDVIGGRIPFKTTKKAYRYLNNGKSTHNDYPDSVYLALDIPIYYFYELKTGNHLLKMVMTGISYARGCCSKKEIPFFESAVEFNIEIPPIRKTRFHFKKFSLSKKEFNKEWDVRTERPPDLLWKLNCLNKPVFCAKRKVNSQHFKREVIFDVFHLEKSDVCSIGIYDYDFAIGDDKITLWKGTIRDLIEKKVPLFNTEIVTNFEYTATSFGVINK